ncbi:MAG: nucleotidyltransferase family protein [Lachnospiraceae bacterium]|nr:nucleotidyltransferase family protein [Lachnospiraceae bacterium]
MTKEEYRKTAEDVIYLISCSMNGVSPDHDTVKDMDFAMLYKVADFHLLTAITAMALESADVHDPTFTQAKAKAIRKVALMDAEMQALFARLNAAGIWYMPLKGTVLKGYYPVFGMRQMADHDILFDAERAEDVKTIMESLGFEVKHFGASNHDCYYKEPVCNFEMHRALFGPSHDERLYTYYRDVQDRLIGDGCEKHFSPEDFYLYMTAHEYKHYSGGGTGLRSLLDTYVYLHGVSLDMVYVEREIEKLGIGDFEAANRSLALHLFGGEPLTEEEREMLDYVLSSGTYGTMANSIRRQIREKGRWGYFLSRMTLPADLMHQLYPVLDKAPVLYPFCWSHRLIHAFFFKHKVFMYQLKAVLTWKE